MEKTNFALVLDISVEDIWTAGENTRGKYIDVSDESLLKLLAAARSNADPVPTLTAKAIVYECSPYGASVTNLACQLELVVTGVDFIGPSSSTLRKVTCQLLDVTAYGSENACAFFVQNCVKLEPGIEISICIDVGPRQNGLIISIGEKQLDLMETELPEFNIFMTHQYHTPAVIQLLKMQQATKKVAQPLPEAPVTPEVPAPSA